MSLRAKIILPVLVLALVLAGVVILYTQEVTQNINHLISDAATTITDEVYTDAVFNMIVIIESLAADPMLGPEPSALNLLLYGLKKYDAVESAFFLDPDEFVLGSGDDADENPLMGEPLPEEFRLDMDITAPIFEARGGKLIYSKVLEDQGDKLGRLQVVISLDQLAQVEADLRSGEVATATLQTVRLGAIALLGSMGVGLIICSLISWFWTLKKIVRFFK